MSWIGLVIIVLLALTIVIAYFVNDKSKRFVIWLLWDFSGLRFVWKKIRPTKTTQPDERPPATFMIWVIGLYIALYGIASQRYENKVDIIENNGTLSLNQIASSDRTVRRNALNRFSSIQNMPCPYKPSLIHPISVFRSLFFNSIHIETAETLSTTIADYKDYLNGIILRKAFLQNADLSYATLYRTDLRNADLTKARFKQAILFQTNLRGANGLTVEQLLEARSLYQAELEPNLQEQIEIKKPYLFEPRLDAANLEDTPLLGIDLRKVSLQGTNFKRSFLRKAKLQKVSSAWAKFDGANLIQANLEGANLENASFKEADLRDAKLDNAWMRGANFEGAKNLTVSQLCKTTTLWEAKFNSGLHKRIRETCPDRLKSLNDP